jgi:DNA-binding response OmpR family regulator
MIDEAIRAIQSIKEHRQVPVIAVGISDEDELRLLMAGADNVFPILFNADALKTEVARVLALTDQSAVEETSPATRSSSSWAGFFARGFERLLQRPKTEDMDS